jgi:hypothetical protein
MSAELLYTTVLREDYSKLIRENEGLKRELEEYKKALNALDANTHKLKMEIIELKYKLKLYQPKEVTDEPNGT